MLFAARLEGTGRGFREGVVGRRVAGVFGGLDLGGEFEAIALAYQSTSPLSMAAVRMETLVALRARWGSV
jgi:hypothetical protein